MKLHDYITKPFTNVEDFTSNVQTAFRFNFLRQGEEADRTVLTNKIYGRIFDWYRPSEHSGDTLITYRTSIMRKYYGKPFSYLSVEKQNEIININRKYTIHDSDYLFEFEVERNGKILRQVCNNYQPLLDNIIFFNLLDILRGIC